MTAEPRLRLTITRPITIEVVGAPGAGKTSLIPVLSSALIAMGFAVHTPNECARLFASRGRFGSVIGRLPVVGNPLLWRLYRLQAGVTAFGHLAFHPSLARQLWRAALARPHGAEAKARRPGHWFMRLLGTHFFLLRRARPGEIVVYDEGFLHKSVQLHASPVEAARTDLVAAYVSQTPVTDLVIHVVAPPSLCEHRIASRGVWPRLVHLADASIASFIANAHQTIVVAVDEATRLGRTVVTVDNSSALPTDEALEELLLPYLVEVAT